MVQNLPYDVTVVAAVCMELILYGMYVPLFASCIWILVTRRTATLNYHLLIPACIMFCLSTIHIAIGIRRVLEGVFFTNLTTMQYFSNLTHRLNIFNDIVYIINNLIGDGLVVYRCWIVWDHNYWVILPLLGTLASGTATGFVAVYGLSKGPGETAFAADVIVYARVCFLMSLTSNICATILIAGRIIYSLRHLSDAMGSRSKTTYYNVIAVVLESASIYTVALIIYVGLYFSHMNAQYILFCSLCQIMSIVPALIIVRVGLGITPTSGWTTTTEKRPVSHPVFRTDGRNGRGVDPTTVDPDTDRDAYPLEETSSSKPRSLGQDAEVGIVALPSKSL